MTVDGGGAAAERLQRSIHELRRVRTIIVSLYVQSLLPVLRAFPA